MSNEIINLSWKGPFKWIDPRSNGIFASPEGGLSGIYVWAVPFQESYLAHYIGETKRSFCKRLVEHTKEYLSGAYRVYDPDLFLEGKKEALWEGMWGNGPERKIGIFFRKYPELAPQIQKFVSLFEIFLIPMKEEKRIVQRVEAAIANHLYKQEGVVGTFQDSGVMYYPRRDTEEPITVNIESSIPILGFPKEFTA